MPTYSFINTETGEEFTDFMSISAKEQYLADNPHIKQQITGFGGIGDPIRMGLRKPDDAFRDRLKEIKRKTRTIKGQNINTW